MSRIPKPLLLNGLLWQENAIEGPRADRTALPGRFDRHLFASQLKRQEIASSVPWLFL